MDIEKLDGYRMPRFSWDYEEVPAPGHWFLLARAYLDCSHFLFAEMIQERMTNTFHHAKAAMSMFEHAVELFLKGALAQAGQTVPTHHRSPELLAEYRRLYPEPEFAFVGKIDEAVTDSSKAPRNQYSRYPQDVKGQVWFGSTHIDLIVWFSELRPFKEDFERLVPLMKAKFRGTESK